MDRYGELEARYLMKVIESGVLSRGEMTAALEKAFAEKFGVSHAITVNSAMSGLHCAVAAAGVGPGDEVICDPIVHFGAAAVMYHNGVPVFADVRPDTFNIDPLSVEKKITDRTKAIICTSLFGLPFDVAAIRRIADDHRLLVIEDNAQAIGARYYNNEKYVGSVGDIGVFSFEQSKQLSSGDGGMVTTQNEELANAIRITKLIGWLPSESRNVAERWRKGKLGWNYRITEMAAAVLLAQLSRVEQIIQRHLEAAALYRAAVAGSALVTPQAVPEGFTHTYWQFACRYEGDGSGMPLEDFKAEARQRDVVAAFGYTQVPASNTPLFTEIRAYGRECPIRCPHYEGSAHYGPGTTPVAEDTLARIVLFAMNVWDMDGIRKNADKLHNLLSAAGRT